MNHKCDLCGGEWERIDDGANVCDLCRVTSERDAALAMLDDVRFKLTNSFIDGVRPSATLDVICIIKSFQRAQKQ